MHRTITTIISMILIMTSAPALGFTPPEDNEYPRGATAGSAGRAYEPDPTIGGPEETDATGVR